MTETSKTEKLDASSPFYLGSGDQPGNLITHAVLTGDNYVAWARAITLSLKARRKFGFLDGTIDKPTDSTKLLDWEIVNSIIVSWLLRSMHTKIASSLPFHDEARQLWTYLERRFCTANGPRLQQLRLAITTCCQTKTMTVDEYFNCLMGFYDDLNRLKPLHACSCGKCVCNLAGKFADDREEEKLHQFFIGIDDDRYGTVRSNLLSQTPPPTLDRAYQSFIQEERSRDIAHSKAAPEEAHAFSLTVDSPTVRPPWPDKSKLTCAYCKRRGHDKANCFKLHGPATWWVEKYETSSSSAVVSTTAAAGVAASSSIAGRAGPVRAHAILEESAAPTASGSGGPLDSLSPAQVQALINMLNHDKPAHDRMTGDFISSSWIIDTGASHHVTGDRTCLTHVQCNSVLWIVPLVCLMANALLLRWRVVLSSLVVLCFIMCYMSRLLLVV